MKQSYEDLRQKYNILDFVGGKKYGLCPFPHHPHHNNTPSFGVFWRTTHGVPTQYFRCHGVCGAYGDVIDFMGYMYIPGYAREPDQVAHAADLLAGEKMSTPSPTPPPPAPKLAENSLKTTFPISPRAKKYAFERGLSQLEIDRFRLGSTYRRGYEYLSIPTFQDQKLMGIKLRALDQGPRYMQVRGSRTGLFNYDEVFWQEGTTLIVKGELAAMVVHRYLREKGIPMLVCAPTGGELARNFSLVALSFSKNIVVADNDPDPETRQKIMAATALRATLFDAKIVTPPEKYKDIDAWWLDNWDDPDLEQEVRRWMD